MSIEEPLLSEEERRAFEKGVVEFNTGFFFECHDTLEDLWAGIRGPSREFFQGLIQVSVAFYHMGKGNRGGASSMLRRALVRLRPYPDGYFGLELMALRKDLEGLLVQLGQEDSELPEGSELPKWLFRPRAPG